MPIQRCGRSGKGWRYGNSGKCYASKADAVKQMQAILASGYHENSEGAAVSLGSRGRTLPEERTGSHPGSPLTSNTRAKNPLRSDPSRTATLRRLFEAELRRRFARVAKQIQDLLLVEDAFGLVRESTFNAYNPSQPRDYKGRWTSGGGGRVLLHGTTRKVAEAFIGGYEIEERERARTLSEFGSGVIYMAEEEAPHQALMFSSGKSEKGSRVLIAVELQEDTQVLDVVPWMVRRPMMGSEDTAVLKIEGRPAFTDDMRQWLEDKRASLGRPLPPDRIMRAVDPTHPEFDTSEYAGLLPGYAKDRGYGAIHLADETLVLDRKHIKAARKVSSKERKVYEQRSQDTKHLRSQGGLYTKSPGTYYTENYGLTTNARWVFRTKAEQIAAFLKWLQGMLKNEVLAGNDDGLGEAYWRKFVEEAYQKGQGRAFDDVRVPAVQKDMRWYNGTKEEFLRSSFGRPMSVEKVQLMAGRVFTDLKGVTESVATVIGRELTEGFARGDNPHVLARRLKDELGFGSTRAATIARTEVIRAHAEGQLDAMERLGVTEVGVMVEWDTAGDGRVCRLCQSMDNVVLTIKEARGMIPRHPNCRCVHLPANVGEPKKEQVRRKEEIQAAITESLKAEKPKKRTLAEQRKRTRWIGPDKRIAKKRPVSVVNYNPNQPRDARGRWGSGGGSVGPKQTDSKEFKEWFGDSKIVDENGEPLVVYHGTYLAGLDTLQSEENQSLVYTTPSQQYAQEYGGEVYAVYAKINNPRFVEGRDSSVRDLYEDITKSSVKPYDGTVAYWQTGPDFTIEDARSKGYFVDTKGRAWFEVAVESPTQLKSATGNRGTFDPSDPIITHGRSRR